ncbi:hypothetical protein YYG_03869 [Plasmodium vinckei petteri]|uniref:Clp1 P-loop domain-containing protein n=1 Tax=Plasmodium vinckei petteri TaxID=138298 RepID=W7ABZ4_PLAVN|nr:hypothetical protein YYG_03869 [Plasmodium vinckei petteri]CAD2097433.1 conserved Plasmodium protein, unknown function [Plasmodium vinckei petteri]
MPCMEGYDKCLYDFEENLKKSYDRIKKLKKNEEIVYEHTKLEDSEIQEKRIYLLGLNYGEYILLRGNFRFRLIKGLANFNGEIIKPSIEYKNVHIPDFSPMTKLIALNDMNIKCEDGMFKTIFHGNTKDENKNKANNNISNTNIHNEGNVEKCNEDDPSISKSTKKVKNEEDCENFSSNDINKVEELKDDSNKNSEHFDKCMNGSENIPECSEKILENYLFCLNMLENGNIKKEEFYEYLKNFKVNKTEMINKYASNCMMDTINLHFENFPIIIAFEKKKNFWYNLYNSDPKKIINITNSAKNNSIYMNSYQMSYIVKEFMLYTHNKKKYKVDDILKKIEEESISRNLPTPFDDLENKKENIVSSDCKENETNLRSYKKSKVENVKSNENVNSLVEGENTNYKINENDKNGENDLGVKNKLKTEDYLKKLKKENIYEEKMENNKNEQSKFDAVSSIIIMGDKGKGKSYFVTNFINNLLNYNKNGVLLLDIDVGQPVIGISGFISLYKIKSPLNIYNFFYPKKFKCIKKIFFGSCSITDNPNYFIKCLEQIYDYLFDVYLKKKLEKIKEKNNSNKINNSKINIGGCLYPLVVNTFGWVKGIGLFLLNLNILLSRADFIVQIDSLKIEKRMKQLFSKEKFYEYMFNDFLITHNDKKMVEMEEQEMHCEKRKKKVKNKYIIFNLNNKHVKLIAKEHSIFNTIIKYNYGLNESDLLFYDCSMSFKKEEKIETERKDNKNYINKHPYKKKIYNMGNNNKSGFTKFNENNKNVLPLHNERGEWNDTMRQYNNYGFIEQNQKGTKDFRDYWKTYCYKPLLDYIDNSIMYKNESRIRHTRYRTYFYKRYQDIINPMISKYSKNESKYYNGNEIKKLNNLKNFEKTYYDNFSNNDKNRMSIQSTENSPFLVNNKKMGFENKKDNYIDNNESIKNYDDYIKKIENIFEKKCIRIINFVSHKKNNFYENLNKLISQNKNVPILPKNLRAYRFFCFFFFKFKKIIFYLHSFSPYDGIDDFFMKHEHRVAEYVFQVIVKNEEIGSDICLNVEKDTQNYSYMEVLNNSSMEKGEIGCDSFYSDNNNEANKSFYELNEYKEGDNLSINDNGNDIEKLDDIKNDDIEIENTLWNDTIYKSHFLFNCVIFDLKNIKLSNIAFNKNSDDIYEEGNFLAYKYFFNNIICLCSDNIENNIHSKNDEKNLANNKKLSYNITRLDIGTNFENINSFIKKTELEKNNVKIVDISEHFTHILTAYIKLIDNMKLIIYLPYWFTNFDILKNVNTFVSGMNLIPYNINDMINNYPYYVDIVIAKEDEIFKFLKDDREKEVEQTDA